MVFQNYALWPHMTVWDNVAFGLVERRESRQAIRAKVGAVLELVGLADYARRRPAQLSGGQQQRVALARTIVIEPRLLLLDEPLSNLDKQLRVQMRDELKNLQRKLGLTTLFVTHDQEEAMTTADRMAVLDQGVLQQTGTAAQLYDEPANRFVAGFVGSANVLEGSFADMDGELLFHGAGLGAIRLSRLAAPSKAGGAALVFRPHQVRIEAGAADDAPDASRRWLDGRVESAEFLGEFTRYRVRVNEASLIADQPHCAGAPVHAPGAPVRLGLDPAQLHFVSI
jgi:iron(III) transport system ATP-binding protein